MTTSKLLIDEYPLQVLPSLAKLIGLNEAIVLQQVHYWLRNAERNHHSHKFTEGHWWTWGTYEDWQRDNFVFWSTDTIGRTFRSLEKKGYLISRQFKASTWNHTKAYTIDYGKLQSSSDAGCNDGTPQDDTFSLTETSSETSPEIEEVAPPLADASPDAIVRPIFHPEDSEVGATPAWYSKIISNPPIEEIERMKAEMDQQWQARIETGEDGKPVKLIAESKPKPPTPQQQMVETWPENIEDLTFSMPGVPGFAKIWREWEAYRREIKKPLKKTTRRKQLAFLLEQGADAVEILETSMTAGWTGLFPLKKNGHREQPKSLSAQEAEAARAREYEAAIKKQAAETKRLMEAL